ncbi:MAG: tetraacyldisaccharide 4'-kinase [Desulfomonilaceae bacterium]|nr:tetraacyldisaccharide 4'-kinase [Desulfomonilaceae bacterium]
MRATTQLAKAFLLLPAAGYYAVQKVREKAYSLGLLASEQGPVPVVSVGNILLGGSGKTPFVIFLAQSLHEIGLKPAVVSRGYRGRYRGSYLVVSDGIPRHEGPLVEPDVCGDEPRLMAERLPGIPVIVGRKRIHPVRAARDLFHCNVVILDDGFQHLSLERTVDVVLLNGTEDCMFPVGSLREPISALRRADVVVLVGEGTEPPEAARPYLRDVPVFRCRQHPAGVHQGFSSRMSAPDLFSGTDVLLASAIAHPKRFRDTAETLSWSVRAHKTFPDHHVFSDGDLEEILRQATDAAVVVTEKDWVKLPHWAKKTGRVWALRIEVEMEDEGSFRDVLLGLLEPR